MHGPKRISPQFCTVSDDLRLYAEGSDQRLRDGVGSVYSRDACQAVRGGEEAVKRPAQRRKEEAVLGALAEHKKEEEHWLVFRS